MPVKCVLQGKKYRIIGPDGKIEMNAAGTPVDGKGHATMEACRKQAAAININLSGASVVVYEGNLPFATSSQDVNEIQRFKKDMIRVGEYVHPVHGWKLNVTPERLQRWLTNFKAMQENGVDVEFPLDHSLSAEKNLGYVVDAMIEPDANGTLTMFGIIEVTGKDAISIVQKNKNVSVWVAKDYKDGEENYYGEVIKHCAVVQQPVVPGQADFIPIAASEQGGINEIKTYYQGSTDMKKEQLEKLKSMFGLGEDATEENILSLIETSTKEKAVLLKKSQDEVLSVKSQLSKDKAASQLFQDPNTLELVGTTMATQLSMLVEKGNITPDVAKELSTILIGEQGQRNAYTLSLGKDSVPSIASQVLKILGKNDPVKIGEMTKAQTLSREIPGGDTGNEADKEGEDAMACGAGVEVTQK